MKKISFVTILALLFFAACNPNKELYEMLDAAQGPFQQNFSYTLKNEDYTTIKNLALEQAENEQDSSVAKDIDTYKSFGPDRPAETYIPLFLNATFIAPDSGSMAEITYNFDYTHTFTSDEILNVKDTLNSSSDFSVYTDTLSVLYPDAEDGQMALVKYINNDDTNKLTSAAVLFVFQDGVWQYNAEAYYLTNQDYEEMGDPGPGHYHNFSADYPPENFLPTFLKLKFPYSLNGDAKEVIYKYYSGTVNYVYTKYFYDGDKWNPKEVKSAKFFRVNEWVYDPTIRFEMTCDDYQIIVDYVKNNDTLSAYMHPVYDNTEYYFGASSYYCNFDMRVYKRRENDPNHYLDNLTDEEALQVIFDRLQEALKILLETKYPDAQPIVNGVQLYAEVTFSTYEPARHKYMMRFECTAPGRFEYVPDSFTQVE